MQFAYDIQLTGYLAQLSFDDLFRSLTRTLEPYPLPITADPLYIFDPDSDSAVPGKGVGLPPGPTGNRGSSLGFLEETLQGKQ